MDEATEKMIQKNKLEENIQSNLYYKFIHSVSQKAKNSAGIKKRKLNDFSEVNSS